jgi:TatD DNase family protein
MRLIDSHAHLDDRVFDKDRATVIARAFSEKIGVLTVGADLRSSERAVRLAERHRSIWAAAGVHPHDAKTVNQDVLDALERLAQRDGVVAIGEIGLDYYRDLSPRNVQRRAFEQQLALARRLDLPVCLHDRESTADLLAILRAAGDRHHGVVHSFLGEGEFARAFLELGLHLGIGGPLTFPKNNALRDAVRHIPLDRILIETDCPYLTPVPYRGRRNEPAYVRYVAKSVAAIKGIAFEDAARQTTENSNRLFGLAV